MIMNPKESTSVTRICSLDLLHYLNGLLSACIGSSTTTVPNTKPKDYLGWLTLKDVIDKVVVDGLGTQCARSTTVETINGWTGESVVELK